MFDTLTNIPTRIARSTLPGKYDTIATSKSYSSSSDDIPRHLRQYVDLTVAGHVSKDVIMRKLTSFSRHKTNGPSSEMMSQRHNLTLENQCAYTWEVQTLRSRTNTPGDDSREVELCNVKQTNKGALVVPPKRNENGSLGLAIKNWIRLADGGTLERSNLTGRAHATRSRILYQFDNAGQNLVVELVRCDKLSFFVAILLSSQCKLCQSHQLRSRCTRFQMSFTVSS